jgi:uncharacterized protein YyaL (SSP411 family)
MNRLAHERSPYLLQHATNPVDWRPWGEDACAVARQENKPIFLSIGYSTCHWCHVMAHESFESAAVAAVLNEHFISVKVDREERPDVDRVYMTYVQATTGSGGWPMSVWLTPELRPFYGGTYFPPSSRWGRPGFIEILQEIARLWQTDQARLRTSADDVVAQLAAHAGELPADGIPTVSAIERTATQFAQTFDQRYGGFGQAPKFPRPTELLFLLREFVRTGRLEWREMVAHTLRAMALGGMRDHVGGGFHRYSVDREWRVPHFEKMLYDQAQLVLAYIECAQATGDRFFLEVAEDTLRYVLREMTHTAGGFYSAEDADSVPPEHASDSTAHKTEGAFYLWTRAEIDRLFGADADIVARAYGIEPDGNAPADPHGEFVGKNIVYVAADAQAIAVRAGRPVAEVEAVLRRARMTLFEARLPRPRPHLDDKVLTAWNGLMIAAFARMARVSRDLGEGLGADAAMYREAAWRAASFVKKQLWNDRTRTLLRRYRDGHAEIEAYAEDYAYLIFGVLELFWADLDPAWLTWAMDLQRRQDELFWDEQGGGGWFSTTGQDPTVLLRMKETYDGAEPTATSIGAANLLTFSVLLDEPIWGEHLGQALRAFGVALDRMGRAVPMMAAVVSHYYSRPAHVVVTGEDSRDMARALALQYLPQATTIVVSAEQQRALADVLPLVRAMTPVGGAATAYVCRDFTCLPPMTRADQVVQELTPVPTR